VTALNLDRLVSLVPSLAAGQSAEADLLTRRALVALGRLWRHGEEPAAGSMEATCLDSLAVRAGGRWPYLALPTPAEALAALRTCGNPLCGEMGGDSEAGLPRRACTRCRAVSYCSPACQWQQWALGHKQQCAGPPAAAGTG
jgi:hypothetical protein